MIEIQIERKKIDQSTLFVAKKYIATEKITFFFNVFIWLIKSTQKELHIRKTILWFDYYSQQLIKANFPIAVKFDSYHKIIHK